MCIRDRARAALYQKDGRFQLIVQHLEEEGVGQLYRRFLETKSRLEKEGLFDPAKKRPIPYWPKRIGVITSSAGAVLSDMIVVLRKQAPSFDLLLYPTAVQGENAPGEIVQAIEQANRERKVDVLIVGRGGGSFEDLYAYNEEIVVRAIRDSKIPVISAVGHETDVTLADFAADLRMPTPTAAAGAVMPQRKELSTALERVKNRLTLSLQRLVEQKMCIRDRAVTCQNRVRFTERFVVRRPATSRIVIIHRRQIVMDQRIGVDHFQSGGERHGYCFLNVKHGGRAKQQCRPDSFAAGGQTVGGSLDRATTFHLGNGRQQS